MKYRFALKQTGMHTSYQLHYKGNLFKISGVCFKIIIFNDKSIFFNFKATHFPD